MLNRRRHNFQLWGLTNKRRKVFGFQIPGKISLNDIVSELLKLVGEQIF